MTKIEENEWISKAKLNGPFPFLEPNQCQSGTTTWSSPLPNTFMVRGPQYFKTKAKIRASDYLAKPLAFDWIKGDSKISNIINNYPKHRVRRAIEDAPPCHKPFVFAFNFQLPTKDHHSIVVYFATLEPFASLDSLMNRFLKGDDGFRNSRLKLIVNMVNCPWVVTKAIGEQAICLIGRVLTCTYHSTENSMQVDIDVGSSMVASALCHLCFRYLKNLTVDMAFVIECRDESELPEQVLGAFRFSGLEDARAVRVEDV